MKNTKQKIVPHLWFDKEAKEAAAFYTSIFPRSEVSNINTIHDTPSGDCDIVSFELLGYEFMAISAGPLFKFNPSISFIVNCNTRAQVDELWEGLSAGGSALMPLDAYPFSERYGWIQDKYGLSWQLILSDPAGEMRPDIIPSLLFVGEICGKAEEAINFYTSVFKDARIGAMIRYGADQKPDKEGTVMFADFTLLGQWFAAMDSAREHSYNFNEAISLLVRCDDQEEIDYYWEKLSKVPGAEQCGWLKDQYGLSWQIAPAEMDEMMKDQDRERLDRVTRAFLKMKKFNIAELREAYEGKEVYR